METFTAQIEIFYNGGGSPAAHHIRTASTGNHESSVIPLWVMPPLTGESALLDKTVGQC
ncbi:MAG: hypothetical protein Q7J84_13980 [Sulfuricaulis sp.]|nr:hypothetical protein [Sulfuricaulis sp.]